jgi:uncharacterized membrane-anchored protein YhcB (DUF1043 family)
MKAFVEHFGLSLTEMFTRTLPLDGFVDLVKLKDMHERTPATPPSAAVSTRSYASALGSVPTTIITASGTLPAEGRLEKHGVANRFVDQLAKAIRDIEARLEKQEATQAVQISEIRSTTAKQAQEMQTYAQQMATLFQMNTASRIDALIRDYGQVYAELQEAKKQAQRTLVESDRIEILNVTLPRLEARLAWTKTEALTVAAQGNLDITGRLELFHGRPA